MAHLPDEKSPSGTSEDFKLYKTSSDPEYASDKSEEELTKEEIQHDKTYRGVERINAVNDVMDEKCTVTISKWTDIKLLKVLSMFFLFVHGYASGLDGNMSGGIQNHAMSYFSVNPQEGTLNTAKSVIAAAVLVPWARLSDRMGRIEAWLMATLIYIVGRVVTAASPTWGGVFAGTIIWEFGYAGFRILSTVLTADLSSLRNRVFVMNIFLMPIIINLWIASIIISKLVGQRQERLYNFRWGFGIGCITVPFATVLLISPYVYAQIVAYKRKTLPSFRVRSPGQSFGGALWEFIERIDLVGILLFAGALCLVLIPLTIAGGVDQKWSRAYIIAMICVGGGLFFIWLGWEFFFSKAPFIPMKRLETSFWAAVLYEFVWRMALTVQQTYVRNILLVGFNSTTTTSQRLGQLYDFMQACTSVGVGIILHFWPHPKFFVFIGPLIGLIGFGLMLKYRSDFDGLSGYIAGDVLVGLGGGMVRFPMFTIVHASIPRDQMAVATGFMMTSYQVGAAVGSAIAGAIWTNYLPGKLIEDLGPEIGKRAYAATGKIPKMYKMGSPVRDIVNRDLAWIQLRLVYVSISLAALAVVIPFFVKNYDVSGDKQTLSDEEREEQRRNQAKHGIFWRYVRQIVGY